MNEEIFSGKFKIQREIATGGMGIVYQALDMTLMRKVAIKLLHANYNQDPAFATRFLREARAMARLDHPNIVRIYAVEEKLPSHFLVMEYFHGVTLKQLIRELPYKKGSSVYLTLHDSIQKLAEEELAKTISKHNESKPWI